MFGEEATGPRWGQVLIKYFKRENDRDVKLTYLNFTKERDGQQVHFVLYHRRIQTVSGPYFAQTKYLFFDTFCLESPHKFNVHSVCVCVCVSEYVGMK